MIKQLSRIDPLRECVDETMLYVPKAATAHITDPVLRSKTAIAVSKELGKSFARVTELKRVDAISWQANRFNKQALAEKHIKLGTSIADFHQILFDIVVQEMPKQKSSLLARIRARFTFLSFGVFRTCLPRI